MMQTLYFLYILLFLLFYELELYGPEVANQKNYFSGIFKSKKIILVESSNQKKYFIVIYILNK